MIKNKRNRESDVVRELRKKVVVIPYSKTFTPGNSHKDSATIWKLAEKVGKSWSDDSVSAGNS